MKTPLIALLSGLILLAGCSREPALPSFGVVPGFSLTNQKGETVTDDSLAGKIWVANFIFTTCQGPCPRMTSQFRQLQKNFSSSDEVRFISFTIDPARDTPPVLDAYGQKFGADGKRWQFLTGSVEELNKLAAGPFHAGAIDGSLTHSTRFVLVDRQGRIRGYYDSSDREKVRELVRDVEKL